MKIAENITELVGLTPLCRIPNIQKNLQGELLLKLESFNPAGSVKDRVALNMILDAEQKGLITKNSEIVEPTSGNTGVGLAFICASRGYKLTLTMPDTMSIERRRLVQALGARVVLTPGSLGMNGAIEAAKEIASNGAIMLQQFENPANPQAHKTTAEEIWSDTEGQVDAIVAGVGTGGSITGIGKILKSRKPSIKIIAVEPIESAVLSGGNPGPHRIQGIGAGFIPKVLDPTIIDEIITVSSDEAGAAARRLAKEEGILAGISSGAALHAAITVASRPNVGIIVVIIPDTGERYLSTWLFEE